MQFHKAMADTFAVNLGGGLYLDASGNLVFGPPTNAQIYHAPQGYAVDLKKIQETFKDLADILPADEDGKKKWADWGVPPKLVEELSKLAGIVGTTATFVSIYLWGVSAMISLMNLMSKDDGMSPETGRLLTNLKNQMKGLEEIILADTMISIHSEFDGRITSVKGKLTNLGVQTPVGPARAQLFADIAAIVDELAVPAIAIMQPGVGDNLRSGRVQWPVLAGPALGICWSRWSNAGTASGTRSHRFQLPHGCSNAALRDDDVRSPGPDRYAVVSLSRDIR